MSNRTPPIRGQRRRRGRADNGPGSPKGPSPPPGNNGDGGFDQRSYGNQPPGGHYGTRRPPNPEHTWPPDFVKKNPQSSHWEPPATGSYHHYATPKPGPPPEAKGPPSWQYTYTYDDKNEDKKPQPGDTGNDWETYDNNPGGRRRREGFDDFDDYDETDTDPIDKVGLYGLS